MKTAITRKDFRRLDDLMQAGYRDAKSSPARAVEKWNAAWEEFLALFDRGGFESIEAFDMRFNGTQYVSNWVQDFKMELGTAARKDSRWHAQRIAFCEEYLRRFHGENERTTDNMRHALAEATFGAEGNARGDALYERWLADNLQWGWGWIGWADNYRGLPGDAERDFPRAEALLRQGLAVPEVEDRGDILERLALLCREAGRTNEAAEFQAQSDALRAQAGRCGGVTLSFKTKLDFGDEGLSLDELPNLTAQLRRKHDRIVQSALPARGQKVGRNDPCPCGSGKKFKKCCGA